MYVCINVSMYVWILFRSLKRKHFYNWEMWCVKRNGEKRYKSIFGSSLYFKVSKKSNLGLIKITKMFFIVIHLNTLLNLFIWLGKFQRNDEIVWLWIFLTLLLQTEWRFGWISFNLNQTKHEVLPQAQGQSLKVGICASCESPNSWEAFF